MSDFNNNKFMQGLMDQFLSLFQGLKIPCASNSQWLNFRKVYHAKPNCPKHIFWIHNSPRCISHINNKLESSLHSVYKRNISKYISLNIQIQILLTINLLSFQYALIWRHNKKLINFLQFIYTFFCFYFHMT